MPALLLLFTAILPLIITPGLLFHYDMTPKSAILGIVAAALLLWMALKPRDFAALRSRRIGRWLIGLAIVQTGWFALTAATSTRPLLSLFGSSWRQFGLLTTIALMVLFVGAAAELSARPEGIQTLLRWMACAGIAGGLYGIAQYFDLDPFQAVAGYHAYAGDSVIVRPPGTMGHADYLGWWLAMEFFCGFAVARTKESAWRAAGIACAAVTAFAILLTGSRAALLALLAGMILLAALGRVRFSARGLSIAAATVCLLGVFYLSPAGTRLRARVVWSGDEPAGGARPLLWRDSLRMALDRPLEGFGPETFLAAFPQFESEDLARQFPAFHHESPHNVALDALTQSGVPGLLLVFAWAAGGFLVARLALRSGSPLAAPLAAGVAASGIAAMFSGLFPWTILVTLLLIAMLAALEKTDSQKRTHFASKSLWIVCLAGLMASALAIDAGALLAMDWQLEQFAKHPDVAKLNAAKWWLPGVAEDIYESRILAATCPKALGVARLECQGAATEAAGRAVRTADDTANAWYNLAIFTAALDDARGTKTTLGKAIAASPNWFKPHWILARLLARTGDRNGALREADRAAFLDAGHDAEVRQTAIDLRSGK